MKKQWISALTAAWMLFALLPSAFAAENAIAVDTDALSILPYCVGDTVKIPVTVTGDAPERVELYEGTARLDTSDSAPFTTAYSSAEAGEHTFIVRAFYSGGGSVDSAPADITVESQRRTAFYDANFDNGSLNGAQLQGGGTGAFAALPGADAADKCYSVTASDGDSSQLVYLFDTPLTKDNAAPLAIKADLYAPQKGTQRAIELKFANGSATVEDLLLFRFKPDGSWAFMGGHKNAQLKTDAVYHLEFLIDLENSKYDCLLLENGKMIYRDTQLNLNQKAEAKGVPVTRFKIQQDKGGTPPKQSLYMDNVGVYRYEPVRVTEIVEEHYMESPDGNVTGAFLMDSDGAALYRAEYSGLPVFGNSPLGLTLNDEAGGPLDTGFTLTRDEPVMVERSWTPLYGTKAEYPENYIEYTYHLTESAGLGRKLDVIFRLYNEGIAFRYVIPRQQELDGYTIESEQTCFSVEGDPEIWYQTQTETIPFHKTISTMGMPTGIRRPMTLLFDGAGAAIVESDLYGYARMHMDKISDSGVFRAALASAVEVPRGVGDKQSPWRAVVLGRDSAEVLERGYLVENLAPEATGPEYADVSWITPGKAVRVANGFSYDNACRHVDFAVDRNLQYIMFDAGWYGNEGSADSDPRYPINDTVTGQPLDLKKITDYAHSKGVKLVVYINNRAIFEEYLYNRKNGREEPRYTVEELLALLSEWGVDGLKPGFVDCDTQEAEQWNLDLARTAAKYHMTVNTHDLYVPAGVNRTYPNFVGAEGIWGDEHPDITAERDLTQFFTRYVQGPADHTWCWYNYRVSKTFRLASAVMSYTPQQYQFWYEGPQSFAPADARELKFWKDVPAVWDDTKVLEGEIGKYMTVARRSGEDWFIGSGSAVTRTLTIPLDFLGEGNYVAEIYQNGPDDYFDVTVADESNPVSAKTVNGKMDTVVTSKRIVDRSTVLTAPMKDSFGYAVRLTPATPEEIASMHFVEITSPVDGASMQPQDLNITASVGDGVERVAFYANKALIGTAEDAPYGVTYPNPGEGTYALTAKAYYADGMVAETESPTVVYLMQTQMAPIVEVNFNDQAHAGLDWSAGEYAPMDPANPADLAGKLTTTEERAHQLNFVPSPAISTANERKLQMEADFLFTDNKVTRGLFEIRRTSAAGQQENPILVKLQGGAISVFGAPATVPYQEGKKYHIQLLLDLKTWTFDCLILEDGAELFNRTGLSIGSADFTALERVKCQQEAVTGTGLASSSMYVDNYKILHAVSAPEISGMRFSGGAASTENALAVPVDTTKAEFQFSAAMQAATFQDAVRIVRLPEETPVEFTGGFSGGVYQAELKEGLKPDTAYRVYFDSVKDTGGLVTVKGYFVSFRTEKLPFALDSFLCIADGSYVSSAGQIGAGSDVSVVPTVRNDTAELKRFTVVACVFSDTGKLVCGGAKQFALQPGQSLKGEEIAFTMYAGATGTETMELYVWDGLRSMRPLSGAKAF